MHITAISIKELPPIENILIRCNERVNLFIGPNGTGKSTILRSMSGIYSTELNGVAFGDDLGVTGRMSEVTLNGNAGQVAVWVSDDWPISDSVHKTYIPATRINIGTLDNDEYIGNFVSPYTMSFSEALNGDYIERALRALHGQEPGENMEVALNRAFRCAQSICHEIITDGPHPHTVVHYDEKRGRSVNMNPAMGIGTIDDGRGAPLHASALSSGTQGTLLWIYALAIEMAGHYEFEPNWHKKPAILLIDEIENHLHPTWQRRVIPALLEHFPSLQIFATTHSPFVAVGRESGQIHQLIRDTNGNITAKTRSENTTGWTADEISREMLDIKDPTDLATAEAADELRQLRSEGPRDTLEAEEQRQKRILELRQLVDRDLLAGGPMARQKEIFEERFARVMERYRESQDLNQEGS